MAELMVSKSMLAKLLAQEDITVVHRTVSTAQFDLKNRTMTLPIWNDMDGDLYDLLVGHEIGHALYTPLEGWHNSVVSNNKNKAFKGFLNVVEDARIEKLVKRKFPGLAKSFVTGYKELYDRDFFGIKNLPDVNKLNLIDRINIRFKAGSSAIVKFSDVEMEFVHEIEKLETWEQVEDVTNRIYAYVKEHEKVKINSQTDLDQLISQIVDELTQEFKDSSDDEYDASEDFEDFEDGDAGEESSDSIKSEEKKEGQDTPQDDSSYGASSSDSKEEDDTEPKSITDNNFREREHQLVNVSGKVHMYTLPEANLENIILDNKIVISHLESFIEREITKTGSVYQRMGISYDKLAMKCVGKFNKNNNKFVMHILKEFEMRKRAYQYARTTQARTGELNMNVLHKYKFTNDLFKKVDVIGKAKNHGMILFLDMSGSMDTILRNTIEQLLVLVSFCKLANIPFDVYGFSNEEYLSVNGETIWDLLSKGKGLKFKSEEGNLSIERIKEFGFHLKHLISSSLSAVQYRKSFNALAIVVNEYNRSYYSSSYSKNNDKDHGAISDWTASGFGLNGTPTVQMLLASRQIIDAFKAKHKKDIVNVIHLTDGDGDCSVFKFPEYGVRNTPDGVLYFVDKKTKKKIKVGLGHESIQTAVTDLVAQVTGCKHIGFRLMDPRSTRNIMRRLSYDRSVKEYAEIRKSYKEHNFLQTKSHGYSKFFYIGASYSNISEDKLEIDSGMTKSKIASLFKKTLSSKRSNRILVSKFSEEIA